MKKSKQKKHIMFVGMDVDKEYIDLAVGEVGRNKEVRYCGRIAHDYTVLQKWARKQVSVGFELHFCYEAGPTGYELYRFLTSKGYDCSVVAPSMIPRKSGDRVKRSFHRGGADYPTVPSPPKNGKFLGLNRSLVGHKAC